MVAPATAVAGAATTTRSASRFIDERYAILLMLRVSAAAAAKSSVVAGVAVAHELGSAALLDSVWHAFVQGMDTMLWVCGGIALVSAILAALFLPRRAGGEAEASLAGEVTEAAGPAGLVPDENGPRRAELEA